MLLTKNVEIKWHGSNTKYFKSFILDNGECKYPYTGQGEEFTVEVNDLNKHSRAQVEVMCDYCESIISKPYRHYLKGRKDIQKDSCRKCSHLKVKEVNLLKYGYEYYTSTKEFREKAKKTNIDRYGVPYPIQTKAVKEKIKQTNIDKYGVSSYTQTQEYLDKVKETSRRKYGVNHHGKAKDIVEKRTNTIRDRYGVENISQLDSVKDKKKQTLQLNYGVDAPAQSEIVRSRMRQTSKDKYGFEYPMQAIEVKEKLRKTLSDENLVKTSLQQKILHYLYGGELNHPYYNANLDIAFPEEKIYMEYNGGGHWLRVKFGHFTEEEFKQFERNRWYSLYRSGWKDIRITSKKDKLPSNSVLIDMFNKGKEILYSGRSWVEFDIDNSLIKTSQYEKDYEYGNLLVIRRDRAENIKNEYGYIIE